MKIKPEFLKTLKSLLSIMAIILSFYFLLSTFYSPIAYAQDKERILEYNVGIISSDKIFKKTYEIKEEITNAVSLCDCTEVSVTKKKDSSLINVEFNPSDYKGLTVQEIKLLGKENRVITLRLRAYVEKTTKPVEPAGVKNNKFKINKTNK
ncbi:MAG: DUF1573 domain-containing protein [Candidatus Omnitrophica bacterium]|nr:DUF1573 domain-containing protein [Candidatus Omnitrophota bacterium]